jgi:hypothetical protein
MALELGDKFNLNCSTRLNKGKKIIVIDGSSYDTFRALVDPFVIPSMLYKFPKPDSV